MREKWKILYDKKTRYTLNAKLTKSTDYRSSPVKYTDREFFIRRLKCIDAHTLLLVT